MLLTHPSKKQLRHLSHLTPKEGSLSVGRQAEESTSLQSGHQQLTLGEGWRLGHGLSVLKCQSPFVDSGLNDLPKVTHGVCGRARNFT